MEIRVGDVGSIGSGSTKGNMNITTYVPPEAAGSANIISVVLTSTTKEDRLKQRISHWMDRMGLLEWTVWGEFVPPEEDSEIRIRFDPLHYQATIYVSDEHSEDQWDWSIVHELLHLMLSPVDAYIDELLLHIDNREQAILDSHKEPTVEAAFNRVCRAIVGRPRPRLER